MLVRLAVLWTLKLRRERSWPARGAQEQKKGPP